MPPNPIRRSLSGEIHSVSSAGISQSNQRENLASLKSDDCARQLANGIQRGEAVITESETTAPEPVSMDFGQREPAVVLESMAHLLVPLFANPFKTGRIPEKCGRQAPQPG